MKFNPDEMLQRPVQAFEEVVYVLRAGEYAKIGRTTNIARRVQELQVGCPIEFEILLCVPGGEEEEKWTLDRFRHLRVRGEWFWLSEELQDWIFAARETRSVK